MLRKLTRQFKHFLLLSGILALLGPMAHAGDNQAKENTGTQSNSGTSIKFVSTGEGDQAAGGGYDAPTTSNDPYVNKEVKESDYAGHKSTQREYEENCAAGDDLCARAKKRQLGDGAN